MDLTTYVSLIKTGIENKLSLREIATKNHVPTDNLYSAVSQAKKKGLLEKNFKYPRFDLSTTSKATTSRTVTKKSTKSVRTEIMNAVTTHCNKMTDSELFRWYVITIS